ncbi:MAG TPA: FAD:protein FMN transferase [Gaiellaceae bacterium]
MTRVLHTSAFSALGTSCALAVSASPLELPSARRAMRAAHAEVDACERALSRFDADSDLSRVNAAAGEWVTVGDRLLGALAAAVAMREATGGRCDPALLPALAAAGYDRSYEDLDHRPAQPPPSDVARVEVDAANRRVRVGDRTAIDLGATAKGWIAARALAVMRDSWPQLPGAVVDLGGDVAVSGEPPGGGPWRIAVESPRTGATAGTIRLRGGGAATSGPIRRRFGPRGALHHLIDPATLRPARAGALAATVVAADPVEADAHATALAIAPVDDAAAYVARRPAIGAVVFSPDGGELVLGAIDFVPSDREASAW